MHSFAFQYIRSIQRCIIYVKMMNKRFLVEEVAKYPLVQIFANSIEIGILKFSNKFDEYIVTNY